MPLTTIKLNLLQIKAAAEQISNLARRCSTDAINLYPKDGYQNLDLAAVNYGRASLYLSNVLAVKLVELGIAAIDNEITYLEMRKTQFEQFYFKAGEEDSVALQERILEIGKDILDKKSQKKQLYNQILEFEIPEDIHAVVISFDKQNTSGHDPS